MYKKQGLTGHSILDPFGLQQKLKGGSTTMKNSDIIRKFQESPRRILEVVKQVKRRRNIDILERIWRIKE
jgi:hypothetical protein|tara:strand:- start:89 stop:298 length:210 start_codon:yes stop_codon:yes gene_type:complete